MNERIKYIYKSILLSGIRVTYNGVVGKDKVILLLSGKDKLQSLRIPK